MYLQMNRLLSLDYFGGEENLMMIVRQVLQVIFNDLLVAKSIKVFSESACTMNLKKCVYHVRVFIFDLLVILRESACFESNWGNQTLRVLKYLNGFTSYVC